MVKNIDILVLGDYFFDLIYSGLPEMPSLGREVVSADMVTTGGAMFITAAALRRLDVSVCWPAQFGSDPYSAYVRGLALEEGIDLSLARTFEHPFRRVTSSMPLHGERAFLTYIDPQPDDVYEFWESAARSLDYRHLHLGSLHYADQIAPIIAEARKKGATVSLDSSDTHHLTTTTDWDALLTLLDIFMPNAREARLITGLDNIPDSLASLRRMVPTIVIKDGQRGAWAADANQALHVPGIRAGDVVDTTGAGDCFNAGFLRGFVIEDASLENCLRYGNVCGGLSVTGVGGATRAPRSAELRDWLAHAPSGKVIEL